MKRVRTGRRPVFLFATILCLWAGPAPAHGAQPARASTHASRLDPVLRQEIRAFRLDPGHLPRRAFNPAVVRADGSPLTAADESTRIPDLDTHLACWVEFRDGALVPRAAFPLRETGGGLFTAHLSLGEIERLLENPDVLRIEAAQTARPNLDVSGTEIHAPAVQGAIDSPPSYGGLSGEGVIIGIVDTGIDLTHPDFLANGISRVVWAWDQTSATRTPPAGFGYGNEWSHAQVNEEIDSGRSVFNDTNGHGTHVAAIAAGNGSATGEGQPGYQYVGIAPEAKLVVVKTSFLTSAIVDAVAYVFDKADALGLPAVVNLSLGHHYGPHDGTELTDLAIDSLVGPGRIVVAAAGNEQGLPIHAEAAIGTGAFETITLHVPRYTARAGSSNDVVRIDGYYTAGEIVNVSVQSPSGVLYGPVTPGNDAIFNTEEGTILIENGVYDPVTEDTNVFVQLHDGLADFAPAAGTWSLLFHHVSPAASRTTRSAARATAEVDLWLYSHTLNEPPSFVSGRTASNLVGSPATADSVIAVGAYVTRTSWRSLDGHSYGYSPAPVTGTLAPFSSNGPRRDGVMKPDLTAPGMGVVSAKSGDAAISTAWVAPDGRHMLTQGTSMAAPHVSGVIALMLQADGPLSKSHALARLGARARTDDATGATPNPGWGAGKLDARSALSNSMAALVSDVFIRRDVDGVHLQWTTPAALEDASVRVTRRIDDGPEDVVAILGPGPLFALTDFVPWDADELVYWLIVVDGGVSSGDTALGVRHGPFRAEWTGARPVFSLSPPVPNPSIATVRLSVTTPETGPLAIDVFDASGRRVRRLLDEVLAAGEHKLTWSGRNDRGASTPAGIYFVRAQWKGTAITRRVLRLHP